MINGIKNGKSNPVFIAGIKYPSLFDAGSCDYLPSYLAFYKALEKSGGEPCKVKKFIVVLEAWVISRTENHKAGYVA
jgi:hypothetical protein